MARQLASLHLYFFPCLKSLRILTFAGLWFLFNNSQMIQRSLFTLGLAAESALRKFIIQSPESQSQRLNQNKPSTRLARSL